MFSEDMLNIYSCLKITKQVYVYLSQIILHRLGSSILFKGNYQLKGCDIDGLLCQIQHFLSQSPPCQTLVKLLKHIIFQDMGSRSVGLSS